jgi:transcriptional regulator with XRE-family HTH domain
MPLSVGKCQLQGIRKSNGWTQDELCIELKRKLGIELTPQMISHYETNKKTMSLLNLMAMSELFERSMDDFYLRKR